MSWSFLTVLKEAGGHDASPHEVDGLAGTFPEHKYGIVKGLHGFGHFKVVMTGGGIDAPSLSRANLGIAEGATSAARRSLLPPSCMPPGSGCSAP
ncbi:hypothetical protein FOMPIDRAFT_90293 [Fomitopsis schrenkii]|uniref:Uncharacterized protein n=1 Tax=Fomitopsis schrenkii TaxID=2126942 RepID=S8FCN6_FOMSC|nr:hypothetical protein FOMPIDRAFT_90293 [Fomitopsis schrenkii]